MANSDPNLLWDGIVESRPARVMKNFSGGCYVEVFEGDSLKGDYRTASGDESDSVYQIAFLHTKKQLDEIFELQSSTMEKALARRRLTLERTK